MGLDRVRADLAVQYVDHNILQADYRNADDHIFLQSAARKLGYCIAAFAMVSAMLCTWSISEFQVCYKRHFFDQE